MNQRDYDELGAEYPDSNDAHSTGTDPVALVWGALRDRLHWAAIAGIALAVVFGAAGYWHGSKGVSYTSTGLVRVVPSRTVILYETEFNQRMPSYESYRNTQATELRSQRVLEWAVRDEKIREMGFPGGLAGMRALQRRLNVHVPRAEEHLVVAVDDPNPTTARELVNAVLRAYMRWEREEAAREYTNLEDQLVRIRDDARREVNDAQQQILALAMQHGTDDLEHQRAFKREELQSLSSTVRRMERELAMRAGERGTENQQQQPATREPVDVASMSLDELAEMDAELANLRTRRRAAETRVEVRSQTLGERHPEMRALLDDLDALERQIERRAEEVRSALADDRLAPGPARLQGITTDELRERLSVLRTMQDELNQEVLTLGQTAVRIQHERERKEQAEARLADTVSRLEAIRTERGDRELGRVEVGQWGEVPLNPTGDSSNKFMAAGAMFGFAAGVGLVAVPGLLRPAYRSIAHLSDRKTKRMLLGALPEFDSGVAWAEDSERSEALRGNLQQMRGVLEATAAHASGDPVAIAITSSGAGEGKTSLTAALGKTYAASGRRVVMIDADFVGRGLTVRCGCEHHNGGLMACVHGEEPLAAVHDSSVQRLSVLPAGEAHALDTEAGAIGTTQLRSIVAQLKQRFDVVLIDTGPVLGSHEACAAAATADALILVIARGQSTKLVDAARERLRRLGVNDFHIVYNRAAWSDLARYPGSVASGRSVSRRSRDDQTQVAVPAALAVHAGNPGVGIEGGGH